MDEDVERRLRESFAAMVVYKRPDTGRFFSSLGMPSFLRDWLTAKFSDESGKLDMDQAGEYVARVIPDKDRWEDIKGGLIAGGEKARILTNIRVSFDVATGTPLFELPNFSFPSKRFEAVVDERLTASAEKRRQLLRETETWGVVEIAWRQIRIGQSKKETGALVLTDFTPFAPYKVDTGYFRQARARFSLEEWVDILLAGVDYNPAGFAPREKLTMLRRLLPFVENRVNLIELAPKGTGKSYLFSKLSKFGWLVSGGSITRARLLYDIAAREPGILTRHDFVALDEIQTIRFPDEEELRGALKGCLESGEFRVGDHHDSITAGFVLLGNIHRKNQDVDAEMFQELPPFFHESALLDRFHGFIRGWDIPRMKEGFKAEGWALNTEYLSVILHELRGDMRYRAFTERVLEVPPAADGRDTEAVKRIMTGLLKLLFPHCLDMENPPLKEIGEVCLETAKIMRKDIRRQLALLDPEYRPDIPDIRMRS